MHVQVNTDRNIDGHERFVTHVQGLVEAALTRVRPHITRVEVHVRDENSHKGGQHDKRCMMEARLEGRAPTAVTHHAETEEQAIEGAADKLRKAVESILDRLSDHHRAPPPDPI